jgi:hypothetical protein
MWITLHFNDSAMTKQWQSITSLTTQWLCFVDLDYMFWFMNEYIMISLIGTCIGVNNCHIHSNVVILSTILITNTNVLPTYRMFADSIDSQGSIQNSIISKWYLWKIIILKSNFSWTSAGYNLQFGIQFM